MASRPGVDPSPIRGGACSLTPERTLRYLHGGATREDDADFRRHLAVCSDCKETFREALAATADVARNRRELRAEKERQRQRARRRAFAVQGALSREGKARRRLRNARLRLVLMPALALLLMLVIYPKARSWGPPQVRLTVDAGTAHVSGDEVTAGSGPRTLARGDWCSLSAGGSAELVLGDTRLVLSTGSLVLIEDARELRVRLDRGRLGIEGPCVVTAEEGIVEVPGGAGALEKVAGALEVRPREGTWTALTSRSEERVGPGETARLSLR